jgi:hypothetical protein
MGREGFGGAENCLLNADGARCVGVIFAGLTYVPGRVVAAPAGGGQVAASTPAIWTMGPFKGFDISNH